MNLPDIAIDFTTSIGIAGIVWLVMTVLVRPLLDAGTMDRFGAAIAGVLGIALAVGYAALNGTLTAANGLEVAGLGLLGGFLSQNLNTIASRAGIRTASKDERKARKNL